MRFSSLRSILYLTLLMPAASFGGDPVSFPVRGLHLAAPKPDEMADCLRFVHEALPREGVNVLVVEFNYHFQFQKRPEVADPDALSRDEVKGLVSACRQAGVKLVPQVNLLGHQSWAEKTFGLLRAHPEFDETPGKYPNNKGTYCRSYCPLHPAVHEVVFDVMDELAEACESDAFHVGMDEVFLLGEEDCIRCKGCDKAGLFAQEVRLLHDHLEKSGRTMWMWGDRFLDGKLTGLGEWEASVNDTEPSLLRIPKDIVICDWHYESAPPTALHFALEGFSVVSSPWRRTGVGLSQLELLRHGRKNSPDPVSGRILGILQTTWCGFGPFVKAYFGEGPAEPRVLESVICFKEIFSELRGSGPR